VPAIDLPALRNLITSKKLAPVHLLVGEDIRLIDRLVDTIEATIALEDRPFAVERLYAGEPGGMPIDIASAARGLPMLGDRRIVIVLRAERLLKPKRAARQDTDAEDEASIEASEALDAGPLEDYLSAPSPSSNLIFVATEIDRTRRLTKRLLEKAQVTTFAGMGGTMPAERHELRAAAEKGLQDELLRAGRSMEPAARKMLVDRAGDDISKLRGDLERLLLYTEGRPQIVVSDVIDVSSEHHAEDAWAIVNAISDGDPARALAETGRRLERGESPHGLVGQLRWWVSTRLAESEPGRVKPALAALLRTDLALKQSGGEDRVLIERLVVELTGRALQRGGWRGK
jgi:DNA polymerase III delta subunit